MTGTSSETALEFDPDRLAAFDPFMRSLVEERRFVGASAIVARRDRTVWSAQVGERDREAGLAMDAGTIFRIYSMTKPVVAAALMTLVDDGRIALTDPVARYLPAFGAVRVLDAGGQLVDLARPMQVVDLLTHTCGLTNELQPTPVASYYQEAGIHCDATRTLQEMVDAVAHLPLAFQPGTCWHYGAGLDVAGALIEVIADQPLAELLDQRLFDPLGMDDTGFAVRDGELHRLAAMYGGPDVLGRGTTGEALLEAWASGTNERRDVSSTNPASSPGVFARGGFGLFSTVGDYLRFAQMLLGGGELDGARVLGPATVQQMHRNHLPAALLPWESGGQPVLGYGFGLGGSVVMDTAATGRLSAPGTFGWPGAATTLFWVDPQHDLIGILMAQSMMRLDDTEGDLAALVDAALLDTPQ